MTTNDKSSIVVTYGASISDYAPIITFISNNTSFGRVSYVLNENGPFRTSPYPVYCLTKEEVLDLKKLLETSNEKR